jgi:hypothetical protein
MNQLSTNTTREMDTEEKKKFGCLQVIGIVFLTALVTTGITLWLAKTYIFPSQFKPVVLSAQEELSLAQKLNFLGFSPDQTIAQNDKKKEAGKQKDKQLQKEDLDTPLQPEAYTEKGASREILFTERELNAMIAKNTDLATRVAIDMADDLISARLRIPLDQDFPMIGGKVFRAAAGLELAYRSGHPIVVLKGVKLMGVPVPNAWLGGFKNIDLVQEFGGDEGFWKLFSDGVESIETDDGQLKITLKE